VAGIKGIRWGPFGRGLIPGDIITSLNGKPVNSERDMYTELDRCKVRVSPAVASLVYQR
jgi:S1-C subfamily serine protease